MKNTIKALSKQFFGAKYESARKSLLAAVSCLSRSMLLNFGLEIAPFILYLTSTFFTARCHVAGAYRAAAHGNDAGNVYAPL